MARYNVYYDNDETGFPYEGTGAAQGDSPVNSGTVALLTLSGLTPWIPYYIAVTAVDFDGNESWYSQEEMVVLQPDVDTTPPYTTDHAPAKNALGVPVDTDICLQVRDDDAGVDMSSISLTVEGVDVTSQSVITGTPADYTVCYDPPVDFGYGQLVDVAVNASDQAIPPNVIPGDNYSFTTFVPTCRGLPATHIGSNGPDILVGTPNDDVMVGLAGDDFILALEGNDVVCAGPGDDFVDGGLGNDIIFGEGHDDQLRGGPGRDRIAGGAGNDHLRGGSGRDFLKGNASDDVLDGGSRNDRIFGAGGDDVALGGFGDDTIACGANFDFANGGPGAGDTATPNCEVTTNIP